MDDNSGNINITDISGGDTDIGPVVSGQVGGDIVGKDKIGGDKVGRDKLVVDTIIINYKPPPAPTDTKTDTPSADEPIPDNPYRGLFAFDPDHAHLFFGREIFTKKLIQATESRKLVAVLGASGSGKSSVVFAGLVPKLDANGQWLFTTFRPGYDPFYALAEALVPLYTPDLDETDQIAQTGKLSTYLRDETIRLSNVIAKIRANHPQNQILLIADQFEELYTLCRDSKTRQHFLDVLLEMIGEPPGSSTHLVLTLRADFLGQASLYRPFADALQNTTELIGPMTREELTEAVEKPAALQGVQFEEKLVERILDDVGQEEGSLPLLEFCLTELWQHQSQRTLTHIAYEEIGQAKGALSAHADKAYQRLTPAEQEQARRIFVQLVHPGAGTENTRRLVPRTELEQDWPLVAKLASERLVVTNQVENKQDTVEVVHEALISHWALLRTWMGEDHEFRTWQQGFRADLERWQAMNRDEGALLRGAPLAVATEKLAERPADLSETEQNFINASLNRELWQRRLRNVTFAGIIIVAIIMTGLAIWALERSTEAERQTRMALSRQLAAQTKNELDKPNYELALLLAVEAASRADTAEAFEALRQAFAHPGRTLAILPGGPVGVWRAVWNTDESRILTASNDGTARVWDADSGTELLILAGHSDWVNQAIWNTDESRILTASGDGTARVWDADSGTELLILARHTDWVKQAMWNADESRILTASGDGTTRVWDADSGAELLSLEGHSGWIRQAVWNADESRILTASGDGTARVWDADSGTELLSLEGHSDIVNQAVWNADESRILTASNDGTARVWDAESSAELLILSGHLIGVEQAEWNADESRILTASQDNTARVWDANSGTELLSLEGHSGWVWQATWNADESRILTASWDNTARVWDADSGAELLSLAGHSDTVNQAMWSADESRILTASDDGTARVWDADSGAELPTLSGHSDWVNQAVWNADESRILTASDDGTTRVWDADSGTELLSLEGHSGTVNQAVWNADESRILTAGCDRRESFYCVDGSARVWDAESGAELLSLAGHSANVNQAVWNADESRILTAGCDRRESFYCVDGSARVWDAESGTELLSLEGHSGTVNQAVWNTDESRILTASADGTARQYYDHMADLLIVACQQAPRNMTQAEWQRFMGNEPYHRTCPNLPRDE